MKTSKFACFIAAAAISAITVELGAEETSYDHGSPWVVYRDSGGKLTADSVQTARKMRQKAARDGYITLWLLLDQHTLGETSPSTDEEYGRYCQEILQPLVARQQVENPTSGPRNSGPVCLVRATVAGVARLVEDSRIQQVMGAH